MWQIERRERRSYELEFARESALIKMTAHQLVTQIHEPRVQYICFAVVTNLLNAAFEEFIPHLGAAHAELAWKAEHYGNLIETRTGTGLIGGQHVHQVSVA